MHVIEARQLQEGLPMQQFEAASRVWCAVLEETAANTIRHARGHFADPVVFTRGFAISHDQLEIRPRAALCRDQSRYVRGIVLPIAIECRDPLGTRRSHA